MRLIDADALKEDLTRFYAGEVTARNLIDEQPTIGGWISVKDRLPEEENACLAVDDECRVVIARYKSAGNYSTGWYSSMIFFPPITHWMPLPEPPKGEERE